MGASRGEGGILGEGVRQALLRDPTYRPALQSAEAMVAVNAEGAGVDAEELVRIFEECGAWQVERAQGQWANGEWADFDAATMPTLIGGRDPNAGADPVTARH